jgi:hypothetical protein
VKLWELLADRVETEDGPFSRDEFRAMLAKIAAEVGPVKRQRQERSNRAARRFRAGDPRRASERAPLMLPERCRRNPPQPRPAPAQEPDPALAPEPVEIDAEPMGETDHAPALSDADFLRSSAPRWLGFERAWSPR